MGVTSGVTVRTRRSIIWASVPCSNVGSPAWRLAAAGLGVGAADGCIAGSDGVTGSRSMSRKVTACAETCSPGAPHRTSSVEAWLAVRARYRRSGLAQIAWIGAPASPPAAASAVRQPAQGAQVATHSSLSRASLRPADGRRPEPGRLPALRRDRARVCSRLCWPASPANAVRLDLPEIQARRGAGRPVPAGGAISWPAGAWTARCARTPSPSIYVYEQTYTVPGQRQGAHSARLLRPPAARGPGLRLGRAARTSGRSRRPRRIATSSCGPRASTRARSSACSRTRAASRSRPWRPSLPVPPTPT